MRLAHRSWLEAPVSGYERQSISIKRHTLQLWDKSRLSKLSNVDFDELVSEKNLPDGEHLASWTKSCALKPIDFMRNVTFTAVK